jgi:hypothetical protein
MTFTQVVSGLILIGLLSSTASDSPTVKVLVLDALDGKPQAGVDVDYVCDEIPHALPHPVITDSAGVAEVPYSCRSEGKIELQAVPKGQKEGCGGGVAATIEDIKSTGVIGKPNSDGGIWCPDKVSRKLKPMPGQVILFIKKPTWWQSHIAG